MTSIKALYSGAGGGKKVSMYQFDNKTAIVTGGGSGLGRAIADRLGREGARVAVADINMAGARETVDMLRAKGYEAFDVYCDVTKADTVRQMVQTVTREGGGIHILVNNTGMAMESRQSKEGLRICDTDEALWDMSINLNLKSVFLCSKYVIPQMIRNGGGSICNIASLAGYFPAFGASYGASKAAVIALTKSIAMQYADDHIRCNCICPGAMQTPTGLNANKIGMMSQESADRPRLRMIDRIADPMEMANVVAFLLSDEAGYITGTEVRVDGGSMAMSVKIPPRRADE